jgi:amidase
MKITEGAPIAAGHTFIDFLPYEHIEASETISKMWSADGGEESQRDTDASREPLPSNIES